MQILMYAQVGKGKGGAEAVFEKVAEGLEESGADVSRVYSDSEIPSGVVREKDGARHIEFSVPPTWKSFFRPTFAYRFFASIFAAYRLLYDIGPDVVNVHFFTRQSLLFALLKPLFGYRLVISCHGSDTLRFRGMKRRVAPFVLKKADVVTCVSEAVARQLKSEAPGTYDSKIIYNGIDIEFWSETSINVKRVPHRIVSIGALKKVKGHDLLIRAFCRVVDEYPEASLRIVGDGPERERYVSLIKNLGLSSHIKITGWMPKEDVKDELQQALLFAFPSRNEGFPLALVEAMASGLPVVASNVGGIPEVIAGTESWVVAANDEDELAKCLIMSLKDKEWLTRAAQSGVQRVQGLSHAKMIEQYKSALSIGSF